MKKKKKIILFVIISVLIIICVIFTLNKPNSKNLSIKLVGKKNITLEFNDKYKDAGAKAYYKKENISKKIKVKTNINFKKLGKYYYSYSINYKNITKKIKRYLTIVDTIKPELKLNGNSEITIYLNEEYKDQGVVATDNYDGDITNNVDKTGEVNTKKEGKYTITYTVKDSSNNEESITRNVNIVQKKIEKKTSSNKVETTSKGYKVEQKDGIYYINGILIVNKTYELPSTYNPGDLLSVFKTNFEKMQEDAKKDGINLKIISGFRSYNTQKNIYNNYVAKDGQTLADRYSARPGHSEHQTGLAADINSLDQSWENTNEGKWLNNNCYKYGFIIRFVKGKENITGYMFEPWHIRYVGLDLAKKLYNNGDWIALEEYLGINSAY